MGVLQEKSYRERVEREVEFAGKLPSDAKQAVQLAGIPGVLFSMPIHVPRPEDAYRAPLEGEQGGRRHDILIKEGEKVQPLRARLKLEGYDESWQIPRNFHLFILPELEKWSTDIRALFEQFVQGN